MTSAEPDEWTGTKLDQLVACPNCHLINNVLVALSTSTPNVELSGLVFALMVCSGCDRKARVLMKFGGNDEWGESDA